MPNARGNLTKVSNQRLAVGALPAAAMDTCRQYDDAGNVVAVIDPEGNKTTATYALAYQMAFPTTVTNAMNQAASTGYDFNTGLVTSLTGLNSENYFHYYNDPLKRLTEADLPDGGTVKFGYCDAGGSAACPANAPTNSVTKTVLRNSCQAAADSVKTDYVLDGLGRTYTTQQDDGDGDSDHNPNAV